MSLTIEEFEVQLPDATQLLSDEPEMESSLHYQQLLILVTCLEWLWQNQPQQRTEPEQQPAIQAEARAKQLTAQLRALEIEPE